MRAPLPTNERDRLDVLETLDLAAMTPYFAEGRFPMPEGGLDPLGLFGPPRSKPVVARSGSPCYAESCRS